MTPLPTEQQYQAAAKRLRSIITASDVNRKQLVALIVKNGGRPFSVKNLFARRSVHPFEIARIQRALAKLLGKPIREI